MVAFSPVITSILQALSAIVGAENVSTTQAQLALHSQDQSFHVPAQAEVVIWPTDAQQVAAVLKLANDHQIPVTPWGVGSSLEGNPIPLHGGILLSMQKMDKVVAVHVDDFQVTVQAGKPYKTLNQELARYGLFFPPDPGANATIGGMLANNAAGIRTVKYGASKANVVKMQVALADGRLIRVGSRSIKQSSGYNLMQLFVGSEGTLGVITEATLKLAPIPEYKSTMLAAFATVEDAVEAVVAIRGSGIDVAALEFFDIATAKMLAARGMDVGPYPTLMMEVHAAHDETMEADVAIVREICEALQMQTFIAITDNTQANALWEARHSAYETMVQTFPDMKFLIMDVAVPISNYPQIVLFARNQLTDNGVMGFLVGHAGDGNIHITLPYGSEETLNKIKKMNESIVLKAIELDGTATGEHGVGIGKREYMQREHGDSLDIMRMTKKMLDPNGILNPGKILPD